ncbi:hypothetical protein CKO15_12545 [Halorhodospira abdelmalekii]|uniref:hypothetical protein n=1 Tax=Halorhodospira abdelmalekii TaxID=421629 RepID=UPI0019051DCB|nr:hypothetical protein [Halorhodospira abdelmalekii]MBK1736085.1 hypothetical protein [Halorhodospira abdelmalekii]
MEQAAIIPFPTTQSAPLPTVVAAEVATAEGGRALTVTLHGDPREANRPVPVLAHARDLSGLAVGDVVVVLLSAPGDSTLPASLVPTSLPSVSSSPSTPLSTSNSLREPAALILHVIAQRGERPRQGLECRPDGSFLFRADAGDVRLEANGAMLELRADGQIQIDGDTVHTHAHGENRITGQRIELN